METTVWCLVRVNGLLCQITQTPKVHDICTFLQCLFVCLFFWFFFLGGVHFGLSTVYVSHLFVKGILCWVIMRTISGVEPF